MTADNYDDDRPGMMRVHIAQERADALCRKYTYNELRRMAKERGVRPFYTTKNGYAIDLVLDGVKP